jgi:adenosine deaminase
LADQEKRTTIPFDRIFREVTLIDSIASFVRALPKAELHVHIEGTLEPELAFELARENGVPLRFASVEEMRKAYEFRDLQSFLDLYYETTKVLRREEDFTRLTLAYFDRAAADGVRHAEIFFDPQAHMANGVPFEAILRGLVTGLIEGGRRHGISSGLILCFLRHLSEEEAFHTLEAAFPHRDRLLGVGLDSAEIGNPPAKFERVFAWARALGLRAVAHAGEEGPPEYVREALDRLRVSRIDHGVRSLEDPSLTFRLSREGIPLTVCPLSNVRLRVFDSLEHHDVKELMDEGILVTINSDDPAYFGGYVAANYIALSYALDLGPEDLRTLAKNSIVASFLDDPRKLQLLAEIDRVPAPGA